MTEITDAALKYAKFGWYVYPTVDKHPIIKGIGPNQATRDAQLIQKWFNAHPEAQISLATGKKSNLFVVDLDNKNNVKGTESWIKRFKELPATLTQSTPHNGLHLFFSYPDELLPGTELKCTVQKIGPGIDTRGEKGACVVCPSKGYVFLERRKLIPVPNYLIEFFKPRKRVEYTPRIEIDKIDEYGKRALSGILHDMQTTTEGSRNNTLNALAYRIGKLTRKGQIPDYAGEELKNLARHLGLDEIEIQETFKSGFNAGYRKG